MVTFSEVSQMAADIPALRWLELIRAEYREMPGLRLTKPQIRRLWGLDPDECDLVIETLEREQFLKRLSDTYIIRGSIDF
jgi:hypothetical protein